MAEKAPAIGSLDINVRRVPTGRSGAGVSPTGITWKGRELRATVTCGVSFSVMQGWFIQDRYATLTEDNTENNAYKQVLDALNASFKCTC